MASAEAKRWPTREATSSSSLVAARGMSRSGVLALVLAVEVMSGRRGAGARRKESCAWAVARRGSAGSRAGRSRQERGAIGSRCEGVWWESAESERAGRGGLGTQFCAVLVTTGGEAGTGGQTHIC